MASVKGRDTKPELLVRRLAHQLGYRFRLYRRDLPGCPDLVFPRLRKVIFVHGCFWHAHTCRKGRIKPVNDVERWRAKLERNAKRDRASVRELKPNGWQVLIVWMCQMHDIQALSARIHRFLSSP
jgi:DNA mismatch endonuclease, patch repair protein